MVPPKSAPPSPGAASERSGDRWDDIEIISYGSGSPSSSPEEEAAAIRDIASQWQNAGSDARSSSQENPPAGTSSSSASSAAPDPLAVYSDSIVSYSDGAFTEHPVNAATTSGAYADWQGEIAKAAEANGKIASALDFQTFVGTFKGEWAKEKEGRSLLQNQTALAFAQTQYDAALAQQDALLEALAAGLCDEECGAALQELEALINARQERVVELQAMVDADQAAEKAKAESTLPAPILQISRAVDEWVQKREEESAAAQTPIDLIAAIADGLHVASSPAASSTARSSVYPADGGAGGASPQASVSAEGGATTTGNLTSEDGIVQIAKKVWSFLKSLFTPAAASTTPERVETQKKTCSLFLSLLGRCNK